MKIYFARSMGQYGNKQDRRDIQALARLGDVVDPNDMEPEVQEIRQKGGSSADVMQFFADTVRECDTLAFRAMPCGAIPAGVAKEIETAVGAGLAVFELPSGILRRTLTIDQTREYLAECGQR